jgi:hypothetical protein
MLAKGEPSAVETLTHLRQPSHQRFPVGKHDADVTAQHLRLVHGQMELAASNVNPHRAGAGHQEEIVRQSQPSYVERRGGLPIGNGDIDVFECDDIAEVLGGAVIRDSIRISNLSYHKLCG